ncbi:hypothetical protein Vretimale_14575 [Volvox reticuliferus]|uniref:Uncharacterized protein n=1 Tax=Volvox reticuliferus TaxID=1737510 RepID=A0A8J4CMJ4_9CHLO|nr:hypothetical protein Vretifemale_13298 [Volvox reticuliferus]GIM10989.1 hypothetical protein Vretimale_14575 [Volvox reticuliferus]
MADRGRKAFPVSSHLCDERWQRHCMELHKQRLSDMKHRIDNTKPETFDLVLSKGKRQMLDKERQTEVDRENAILLQKMVRIKEQDTRAVFRPWTARSTFQWKVGHYYDPATNTKTLDHINLTSSVSPRSIHYFALTRPGTAPPDVTARLRDMEIQVDNTKLLRAITTMRTHYSNEVFERRHAEESILVSRISNFRGPDSARYQPPGRSISASRNSPYLAPLPGRSSSSNRGMPRSPRTGWPVGSPPVSQAQYYEEAQNRDIPPPSSRGNSRPGTAVGGTQEGLGATSPPESTSSRQSASSRQSSLSRHSGGSLNGADAPQAQASMGGSRPGSGQGSRPGSAAIAGTSFSFAGKHKEQRKASGDSDGRKWSDSASSSSSSSKSSTKGAAAEADPGTSAEDDYADDQYDQDEAQDEQDEQQRKEDDDAEASPSDRRASSTSARGEEEEPGYNDDDFAGDDDAAAAGEDDGYTEPTPRGDGDGEEGADTGVDDEQPASAVRAEEDESKKYDADELAGAFEPAEAELRAEMREAEEAEMDQQFAEEMAADTYDDYGMGNGDTPSAGAASNNTAASPKVGGFAEDWD